ncbi:MAG TPA: efflux RND transporter periplasmic adaptor subunit [Thermoanaerobaculia bacterium]|jgi:membrane fusion protein (multidrug efflux system)|nr:efflux RND transporter periplasmic adaptor subunit [Thermoanaerobaculia bacterium]
MNRSLIVLLSLVSLAAAACSKTEAAKPAPPPPGVVVTTVVQHDEPVRREWIGTTQGDVNAEIRPKVDGYLLRRVYTEGSFVRAGQLLFEVDARQAQAQLQQAQANLAQAESNLAKADRDVARYEPLAAQRAISQQELDNARSAQQAARATVGALRAAVDNARLNTSWTRVTSPISGIAGIANAQVGNLVSPSTVLTTVSKVDPIRVNFPISEQEYLQYQRDPQMQHAELELVLADGTVFPHKGRIALSGRDVDVKTGTITTVGIFPNPGNLLRPGQYAKVRATTGMRRNALLVPQRAVNELQGLQQVAVIGAGNIAEVRPVKTGARSGAMWVIEEGLQPGERVVIEGFSRVKDGQVVTPKEASN